MENIDYLLKQLKKQPNKPDIHNKLGQLYQQQEDSTEAAKHYLSAARLFSGQSSPHRNLNKAIVVLKKMLRDFPKNQDSYYLLAEVYTEMDDLDSAVKVYDSLSDMYRQAGKLIMAVSVYDKVTSFLPESLEGWIKFASLNDEAGMSFHAAQGYVRAARLVNNENNEKKYKEAFKLTMKALQLDPENSEAISIMDQLTSSKAAKMLSNDPLYDLAEELEKNGQARQALPIFEILERNLDNMKAARKANNIRKKAEEDSEATQEHETQKPGRAAGLFGTKVLVIDDEREILLLLEQILKEEGFKVLTARDGKEGFEMFRKERPSLIVTDAMLPKLHGFELSRMIKEESGQKARIMILTAVYKKYKYKAKIQDEYKVDEYLDKPFQIAEFLDAFYRMASGVPDISVPEEKPESIHKKLEEHKLKIMVVSGGDRDFSSKVSGYCSRKDYVFIEGDDSSSMIKMLEKEVPDILLITDSLKGMDPYLAAWLIRNVLEIRSATLILVARDARSLNVNAGEFNHRVAAPIDVDTMETIVGLHITSEDRVALGGREKDMFREERRIEAILKTKVDGILKTHYQVEEFYSRRIKELEEEIANLKKGIGEQRKSG